MSLHRLIIETQFLPLETVVHRNSGREGMVQTISLNTEGNIRYHVQFTDMTSDWFSGKELIKSQRVLPAMMKQIGFWNVEPPH